MSTKSPTLRSLNGMYAIKGLMFFGPQYGTQIGSSRSTMSITVDNEALA